MYYLKYKKTLLKPFPRSFKFYWKQNLLQVYNKNNWFINM